MITVENLSARACRAGPKKGARSRGYRAAQRLDPIGGWVRRDEEEQASEDGELRLELHAEPRFAPR